MSSASTSVPTPFSATRRPTNKPPERSLISFRGHGPAPAHAVLDLGLAARLFRLLLRGQYRDADSLARRGFARLAPRLGFFLLARAAAAQAARCVEITGGGCCCGHFSALLHPSR